MQVRVDVDFLSPIKKSSSDAAMAAWKAIPEKGRESLKVKSFCGIREFLIRVLLTDS